MKRVHGATSLVTTVYCSNSSVWISVKFWTVYTLAQRTVDLILEELN